jgi:TRAP-type transport system periplasmic protein
MKGSHFLRGAGFAAVAFLFLVSCDTGTAVTKAGGAAPLVLQLATEDRPGRPGAFQVQEFARQMDLLSDGQLLIEPVWQANGDEADDWDQVVARKVVSGEYPLGMVVARAWDTEGVTSLQGLHAPFLVDSDPLLQRIVTSELADEMLAGLDAVGVTGLALLPEHLRYLFLYGDRTSSPVELSDLGGALVRAPRSDTTYGLIEALGGIPDDFGGDNAKLDAGIRSGDVVAGESSFALTATLIAPTTAIGNVVLFPKANTLVANTAAFEQLTDGQRAWLRRAAQQTLDWSISAAHDDVDIVQGYCENGGRIIAADDEAIEAMQRAAQPVYDELEQDPRTAAIIERIRALREELAGRERPAVTCDGSSAEGSREDRDRVHGAFPDGVYRVEIAVELLVDAGIDSATAHDHDGLWTLFFRDGVFREGGCSGTYSVEEGRVTVRAEPYLECGAAAGEVLFSAGWTLEGDQLQFTDVRSGHGYDLLIETLFGDQAWTRIG